MRGGDVGPSSSGANAAPVFNGTGLARVEERVEGTLQEQADTDFAHILELVRDYLSLVAAVKVSREKGKL